MRPRLDTVVPTARMVGEDAAETSQLRAMLREAESYLRSFGWCKGIAESYLGLGVGEVVAVFLVRLEPSPGVDEWLWVVSGDLPSAYFVTDRSPDPVSALETYCQLMEQWVNAVRDGRAMDSVFPVAADATQEHANMLESRLAFLREEVIPAFS